MPRIRVMIVDDHPCVIQGVKACLETIEHIEIVGHATNGLLAVHEAKRLIPDVILMDLSLPRLSGIEAMKAIHRDVPHVRLIAYTVWEGGEKVREAEAAGATGYVPKTSPLTVLVKAIDTVRAGGRMLDFRLNGDSTEKDPICAVPEGAAIEKRVDGTRDVVRDATEYIQNNHGRNLTLKEVALKVGIHPSDLDRRFIREQRMTVKQYADSVRKKDIERRLRQESSKGSQIAADLGFRDDQLFYRWIRRVFGISFRELRESARSTPGATEPDGDSASKSMTG